MTYTIPTASPAASFRSRLHALTESIKINSLCVRYHAGRPMFVKRRTWLSRRIAALANFYFHIAGIPIRFCTTANDWQRREISTFRLLNKGFSAYAEGNGAVCVHKLPGHSLFEHMKNGTLRRQMVVAAALEFRRAHQLVPGDPARAFTHGDATMSNVLYDPRARTARLIDFELQHVAELSLNDRRADDLLVFLLDLAGFVPERRWLPLARAFLDSYDAPAVVQQLIPHLTLPGGLARIWFKVRTNFVNPKKISHRLHALAQSLRETY